MKTQGKESPYFKSTVGKPSRLSFLAHGPRAICRGRSLVLNPPVCNPTGLSRPQLQDTGTVLILGTSSSI